MKKTLIFVASFIALLCLGQQLVNVGTVANDGTGDPLRVAYQKINSNITKINPQWLYVPLTYVNAYTNTLAASSTDYMPGTNTTITVAGGYTLANCAGVGVGGGLLWTNLVSYTGANDYRMMFEINVTNNSSFGCGVRPNTVLGSGDNECQFFQFDPSSGSVSNNLNWWHATSSSTNSFLLDVNTYRSIGYNYPNFTNAWLQVVVQWYQGVQTVTISNETTGVTIRSSLGQTLNALTNAAGAINYAYWGGSGNYFIWVPGGTCRVRNFGFDLIKPTQYAFLVTGDSIAAGFSDGFSRGSWPRYAADNLHHECVIYGRPGDKTTQGALYTNDIILLAPPLILNALGGNDASMLTTTSNYYTWMNSIAPTINILPTPRFGANPTPMYLKNWMETNGAEYIDIYSSFVINVGNTMQTNYTADAPHPNDVAHRIAGDVVSSYLRLYHGL